MRSLRKNRPVLGVQGWNREVAQSMFAPRPAVACSSSRRIRAPPTDASGALRSVRSREGTLVRALSRRVRRPGESTKCTEKLQLCAAKHKALISNADGMYVADYAGMEEVVKVCCETGQPQGVGKQGLP